MLLNAQVPWRTFRPVAGYLRTNGLVRNNNLAERRDNGLRFGKLVSYPQGVQNAARAIVPTISASDFIRVVMRGDSSLLNTGITVPMVMATTISGEGTLTPNAEVGKTMSVTISGEGSISGDARVAVSMAVNMDAGARPSAFDIMQEVWQAKAVGFPDPTTMGGKVNAAGTAGDPWSADISGYPPGTAGYALYSLDPQQLADAILNDPRLLTVAKFLGLK